MYTENDDGGGMETTTRSAKEFNATVAGQTKMAMDGASIGLCLMLASKIRELGGIGWDRSFIESANPTLLLAIKNDLVTEYNGLVTKPAGSQTT
jgi:hypothetical protein